MMTTRAVDHRGSQDRGAEEPLLEVHDLAVSFGRGSIKSLKGIDFNLSRGEILAIVGESGSGKSVTAKVLCGLVGYAGGRIEAGQVLLRSTDGTVDDLCRLTEAQMEQVRGKRIAMIFQEPMTSLNPVLTIGLQIGEALTRRDRLTSAETRRRATDLLRQVRISEPERRLRQYPHELSGGMRQRVMIAMALACRPDILIADEPTTALDVTVQAEILDLIRTLQRDTGMAVIFITHDMGVVAEVADRVVVMLRGEIVETGTVRDIFSHARHPYTQRLISAAPRLGTAARETTSQNVPARAALSVSDLSVRFPVRSRLLRKIVGNLHAVDRVSFDLAERETLAIVGESGSGKSTLARSILRLVEPDEGSVQVDGREITGLAPAEMMRLRRGLQMVFQDPFASLNPRMRIADILAEPFEIAGDYRPVDVRRQVADLLEVVGLDPAMASRYPHQFSGGQRQRICIARAIALRPRVIIADEAVSALDVSTQAQILELLGKLREQYDLSILFISHDIAVVEQISDRIAVMYLGELVEIGPCKSVLANPSHPYTRKLLAAVPVSHPDLRRTRNTVASEARSAVRPVDHRSAVPVMREIAPRHFVRMDASAATTEGHGIPDRPFDGSSVDA